MVKLTDRTRGLMDYQRAARGRPAEERLELWERLYAAKHPRFFEWYLGERCPRDKLTERLPEYDAREDELERPSRVLPCVLEEIWPRVLASCAQEDLTLQAILFAGGFDADGFCEHFERTLTVFFQAEVICTYPEGLLRVHAAHETAHFLHAHNVLSRDPSFSYKERYFELPVALFCEGLAVALSRRVCPGERLGRYLLYEVSDPQAAEWCQEHEGVLLGRMREVLHCTDKATFHMFFSGGRLPEGIPHARTGYYMGWRVVEELLREHSLPELVRLAPSGWPDLVKGALERLGAGR